LGDGGWRGGVVLDDFQPQAFCVFLGNVSLLKQKSCS
jgi:hypothetical protein